MPGRCQGTKHLVPTQTRSVWSDHTHFRTAYGHNYCNPARINHSGGWSSKNRFWTEVFPGQVSLTDETRVK